MASGAWRSHVKNLFFITVASVVVCFGFMIFITPNNLLSGGFWGLIAIINHYIPQIPFGVYNFCINVPLLIIAWKKLEPRFSLYTLYSMTLQSAVLAIPKAYLTWLPTYSNDLLLACLFGGVIIGAGGGLIVRYYGSSGGVEVLSFLIRSKVDMSIGTIVLMANIIVVSLAALVFGFERAMYTMVSLYVTAYVFNAVLEGLNSKRNLTIITDHGDELAARMIERMNRGVTMMKGRGAYSNQEKDILMCAVSRFELAPLKDIIHTVDPGAFVMINETYEIMGIFKSKGMKKQPDSHHKAIVDAAAKEE